MSEHVEELTEPAQMDQIMSGEAGPAVIDFWSPSCGPCHALAPHFDAVAQHFSRTPLRFYKVNTQAAPQLAAAFSVRSVPTIFFVHRGEIKDAVVGSMAPDRLRARSQWLLNKAEGKGLLGRLFGRA